MITKKALIITGVIDLIIAIAMISVRQYYILIAILIGGIILTHREIWSLLRTGSLPPMDERVRANTTLAIRNSFFFLVIALIAMMVFFSTNLSMKPEILPVLGGLFVATMAVYLFSYIFHDRALPDLTAGKIKLLKTFLMVGGISIPVFIIGVFLHNLVSALLKVEEPVFFVIAVIIAPLCFTAGIIGSLVIFIMGVTAPKPE